MPKKSEVQLHVYADRKGKWRWRAVARNGEKTATGGQAYATRYNALRAARRMLRNDVVLADDAKGKLAKRPAQ